MENLKNFNEVSLKQIIFWGLLYAVIFVAAYFVLNLKRLKKLRENNNKTFVIIVITVISIVGVLIRIILATKYQPHYDIKNFFLPWTKQLMDSSIFDFYFVSGSTTINPSNNYTPMYVYILFFSAKIIQLFNLSEIGQIVVLKLPAIIGDLVGAIFIYKIAKKLNNSSVLGIFFFTMYLFCPAAIVNSAIWGQVDGITSMFTLITIYLIIAKKDDLAIVFAILGVCFKLQFIFAFPALGMYFLIKAIKDKKLFKGYIKSVLVGLILFVALSLPVMIKPMIYSDPLFPITIYLNQVSIYDYYTLNAFNLYGILGLNFIEITNATLSTIVTFLTVLLSCGYVVFFSIKNNSEKNIAILIAITIGFMFTFTTKMHERYMFVIMAVIMCQLLGKKDYIFSILFAIISVVVYLNIALLLNFQGYCFYLGKSDQMYYGGILEVVIFVLLFIYSTIYLIKDWKNREALKECLETYANGGEAVETDEAVEADEATEATKEEIEAVATEKISETKKTDANND